jgi:hypothetical protein
LKFARCRRWFDRDFNAIVEAERTAKGRRILP